MGHIVITKPGEKRPDREFYLVFHDIYADDVPGLDGDLDCFNGAAFLGNTPTFEAKVGEHVRWHVVGLGTEFHVFHLHGHRWIVPAGCRRIRCCSGRRPVSSPTTSRTTRAGGCITATSSTT